jgi:hypothetical protein
MTGDSFHTYWRCSICFNLTTKENGDETMIAIIKTQLGTFIGEVKNSSMSVIEYPCVVDFIPAPIGGPSIGGQPKIGIIRSVYAWPEKILKLENIGPYASSIITDTTSDFAKMYTKTADEAWPDRKVVKQ